MPKPTEKPRPPTDAQLAGARRELRRRPPPIPADFELGRLPAATVLAVRRVRTLYRSLDGVPDLVLTAAATPDPPAERCRWCGLLAAAKVRRQPRPPVDRVTRALVGQPCSTCAAVLSPPKPKPTLAPRPVSSRPRTSSSRSSTTSTRPSTAAVAVLGATHRAGSRPSVPRTDYNVAAAKRLGLSSRQIGWSR